MPRSAVLPAKVEEPTRGRTQVRGGLVRAIEDGKASSGLLSISDSSSQKAHQSPARVPTHHVIHDRMSPSKNDALSSLLDVVKPRT